MVVGEKGVGSGEQTWEVKGSQTLKTKVRRPEEFLDSITKVDSSIPSSRRKRAHRGCRLWWVRQYGWLCGGRAPRNLRTRQWRQSIRHPLRRVQHIATIHWFCFHGCLAGPWQCSVLMLVMMGDHWLWGGVVPRGDRRLLGSACSLKVSDMRGDDLGLPFLNRNQERLHLKGENEWS